MGRLIDADVLKRHEQKIATQAWKMQVKASVETILNQFIDDIDHAPTVDAVPVRHGRWIYHIDDLFPAESTQECDQCHEEQPLTCGDNFCPNCGAKMTRKDGDT